jgi:type III restriction enzyme
MILADYQTRAVERLLSTSKKLLSTEGSKSLVFKAPTGSGKTVMVAEWLRKFASDDVPGDYAFIWISTNNLHVQSKEKLGVLLEDTRYSLDLLEDLSELELIKNHIIFANWESLTRQDESGEWSAVAMRDGDVYKSLRTRVDATLEEGREVILIVDESHATFWSEQSQSFVDQVIRPRLIVEVSATPKIVVTQEESDYGAKGQVSVPLDDVIGVGIIKTEVVVNEEMGKFRQISKFANDALIAASLAKREELASRYIALGVEVNPLLLIQLPSESKSLSALDESVKDQVVKILKSHKISFENGKLAMWLTGNDKINLDHITDNDNKVEVLIFKSAISKGWDCPRADILLMLREIKSVTFKTQTVGRIMRMPEAKHYEDDVLNKAYVYTNVGSMNVDSDKDSQAYFALRISRRKKGYEELRLPAVYLSRSDYGDLTYKFRALFVEKANERFGINEKDSQSTRYKKADKNLELYPSELTQPVIVDAIFKNIDGAQEITGQQIEFDVPADKIKNKYTLFAKLCSLPFAPVRSHTKVQEAIYDWFDTMGYEKKSRLDVQRAVVCSEKNQPIFKSIIESAKEEFVNYKRLQKRERGESKYTWDVKEVEYLTEEFEPIEEYKKYVSEGVSPRGTKVTYLKRNRPQSEREFETFLETNKSKIKWWYKNGEKTRENFGIPYTYNRETNAFYPDYIVKFLDKLGIYEVKVEGDQGGATVTKAKAEALQDWARKLKRKDLECGIVIKHNGQWLFNQNSPYKWEKCLRGDWSDWKRFET